MRRCVRAAASLVLFLAAQAINKELSRRVAWVGGGSPKTQRAEQRRLCSYRGLESNGCGLGQSLGTRAD